MITVRTLTDGGQTPLEIAGELATFLGAAKRSLEIAIYDFNLTPETAAPILAAVRAATGRGVAGRVVYNVDERGPIGVPPPSRTDETLVDDLGVPFKPIPGVPDLMHHKYAIRDGEAVWTGSTNWTDDSWSREENAIVQVASPQLAAAFGRDFDQLWETTDVAESGRVDPDPVRIDGVRVRAWFCPGEGEELAHHIAHRVGRAKRRVRIASPVITSGPVLGTLAEVAPAKKVDLAGVVDLAQMQEVLGQWQAQEHASWKIAAVLTVFAASPFSAKHSTPYAPGSVHDYMHAKITVADDVVFVGSYNLSHSGELNAENVLEIEDAALAERLAGYVDGLRARYPPAQLT